VPVAAASARPRFETLDLLLVLVLLGLGAGLWIAGRARMPGAVEGLPAWAGPADRILFGPDAGAWAASAWALHLGRWEELDPHRMPTWPALTSLLIPLHDDVALAGHLLNHLLHLALPLVVYAVARATCGRGPVGAAVAFGAALNVMLLSPLVLASHRASVDPMVALAQPLALLAGLGAARWPVASPLFGALVALCSASHLTTLGVAGPALMLALCAGAPGARRWMSALGLAAGACGVAWLLLRAFPVLSPQMFVNTLAEGVTRGRDVGAHGGGLADEGAAIARVRAGLPLALEQTMRTLLVQLRPMRVPWYGAMALPWLALLGLGLALPGEPARGGGARVVRGLWRMGAGVALLGGLAPMVAFSAAGAPERYATNFLPVGALVFARGIAAALMWLQAGGEALARRWTPGVVLRVAPALAGATALGALAWAVGLADPHARPLVGLPPSPQDVDARALGDVLAARFPPGGGAGCRVREAAGFAGRSYCPAVPCPGAGSTWEVGRCLEVAVAPQCGGAGDIPWVVVDSALGDERTDAQKALDAWVDAHFEPLDTVRGQTLVARVYALPRGGRP
jgi:hypothetical protein